MRSKSHKALSQRCDNIRNTDGPGTTSHSRKRSGHCSRYTSLRRRLTCRNGRKPSDKGIPHSKQRHIYVRGISQYVTCHNGGLRRRHRPENGRQHTHIISGAVCQPPLQQGGIKRGIADSSAESSGREKNLKAEFRKSRNQTTSAPPAPPTKIIE